MPHRTPHPMRQRHQPFRLPPPVVFAIAAALMYGLDVQWPAARWVALQALQPVLSLLIWAGAVGMAGSALLALMRARTTVDPRHPERARVLVRGGVYGHCRHPMYLVLLLILLGWGCWLAQPLSLLGPLLAWLYLDRVQVRAEELALSTKFGQNWQSYCQRVRRWL